MKRAIITIIFIAIVINCYAINWDERLSENVREDFKCKAMDYSMEGITVLGSKEFVMASNLAAYTFCDDEIDQMAQTATLSLITGALVTTSLKFIVNRERPLGQDCHRWDSSFPSGHTTAAFATATAYGLQNKKLMAPLLTGATLIALSRVYLGEHYVLDVIVGAIIGSASAIIIYQFEDEIYDRLP